jgi:cellulose synthase operon protein C
MRRISLLKICRNVAWCVLLGLVVARFAPAQEAARSTPEAIEQYRVAEQYQKLGEYDLAAKEWQKLAEAHANDPLAAAAVHYAGVCQYQLADYAQAAERFAAFVAKYPRHELAEASLTNLGLAHYNLAQKSEGEAAATHYGQAITALDRQRKEFPEGKFAAQGDFYRAESLYAVGQLKEAEAAYREWLTRHADNPLAVDVRLALGATQTELGDPKRAIATLGELLGSKPEPAIAAEASLRLGDALAANGEPAKAAQQYAAAASAPGYADADYALEQQGAALFAAEQYEAAAKVYASLPERFPQSPRAAASRAAAGKSYYQLGDFEQAARWLAEGVKARPQDVDTLHWYVRTLMKSDQPAQGLAALDAQPLTRDNARLLLDRADLLYEIADRRQESIAAYVAAAEKGTGELAAEALHLAAATALELGASEQAAQLAERVIKEQGESSFVVDARQTLAEAKLQLGQPAEAAKIYEQLLPQARDDQRANWALRLAWAKSGGGDDAGVIATLGPVTQQLAGEQRQEAQYLLGRSLLATGKAAEGMAALEQAATAVGTPWHADAQLQLARAQQQAGELPASVATLDKLIAQNPGPAIAATAYFRRGEVKQKSGDTAGARADYAVVAEQWKEHALAPYALYRAAMLALEGGEAAAAIAQLNLLLTEHPTHKLAPDARLAVGTALVQTKDFARAIETLEAVVALNDYAARDRAMYELAWAYRDGGEGAGATKAFTRLAEEFPESPYTAEAHYRLGESLYDQQQWKEALARFDAAAKVKDSEAPLREKALHMAAWAELKQGSAAEAAARFADQVKQYPEGALDADGRWMQGEALFQAGQHAEALEAFAAARDLKPTAADLAPLGYLHAGQAAAALEEWEQSADWLAAARQQFTDYAGKNHLDFEWGVAQWKLGKNQEALAAFKGVADSDGSPLGARARFMVGELQFAAKEYEAAVRSFFQVSSGYQYPNSPEAYHPWQAESLFEAARCLEQLKRSSAAEKLYAELVQRFPNEPKARLAEQRLGELGRRPQ